jgi:hypothetical protein
MASERKPPRKRTLKTGTIILGKKAKLACTVLNLSESGACLEVSATFSIPSTFLFGMSGQTPQTCKVIWRTGTKLGVHFQ